MAIIVDFFIDQGSDYENIITINDSSGSPRNLTGYTVASQIRKGHGSTTSYPFTAALFGNDPATGRIILTLTNTQTSAIPAGRYVYDIELTSPAGKKSRVIEGIVTLSPETTR